MNCWPAFFSNRVIDKFYHGFCNRTIWPLRSYPYNDFPGKRGDIFSHIILWAYALIHIMTFLERQWPRHAFLENE
ncbi:MAG: hypothetical protein H5T42_01500 [Methanothrix sp.]|nr:hypothetical protein [Methanothrix sp.]NPU87301.1 hypothetical protein [Methanothrix sp.]